jgi:hypothetical protein
MTDAPTGDGARGAVQEMLSGNRAVQRDALSEEGAPAMAVESSGHSRGNPRLYELIEHAPKTGPSPTVWAFPQLVEYLKVAAQPVQGPWPPHQHPRPDPEAESMPVAIPDPAAAPRNEPPAQPEP